MKKYSYFFPQYRPSHNTYSCLLLHCAADNRHRLCRNQTANQKLCLCRLVIAARMGSVMLVVLTAGWRQTVRTCIGTLWVTQWFAANWYIVLWEVTNPQKPATTLLRTNVGCFGCYAPQKVAVHNISFRFMICVAQFVKCCFVMWM